MSWRRFVVVVLPARDTRLGTLAADSGCQIQLLARRAPGPSYDIEFEAKALLPEAARAAESDMAGLATFTYSVIDAKDRTWNAAARVPVTNIASRTYRAIARATLDAGSAWLVLDAGYAQLRLLPAAGVSCDAFAAELSALISTYEVPIDMYTMELDATWYEEACQGLRRPLYA